MRTIDNFGYGDIVLADFVFSDQRGSKLRPCLVLYKKGVNYVVLKMTSQDSVSPRSEIEPDSENNLRAVTYIDIQTIVTLQKDLFIKKLGVLDEGNQQEVRSYRTKFPEQW